MIMSKAPKPKIKSKIVADGSSSGPISVEERKDKRSKKLRHSNWMITANTNKRFYYNTDEGYEAVRKQLLGFIDSVTADDNILKYIEGDLSEIKNIEIESAIELDDKSNKKPMLHCHIMIACSHYGSLKLKYIELGNEAREKFNIPMVRIKVFNDSKPNLRAYIRKGVIDSEIEREPMSESEE